MGTDGTGHPTGAGAGADEPPVRAGSALHAVVVHPAGAECRRRARVPLPLPAGGVRVELPGLPPVLDPRSLRAGVRTAPPGCPPLHVTDVRFRADAALRDDSALPPLVRALQDAERRYAAVQAERDRLSAAADEIAALRPAPPPRVHGEPPRRAPVEAMLAFADFAEREAERLHEQLARAEREAADAEHAVRVARHRIDEAGSALPLARTGLTGTAVLTLAAAGAPQPAPTPDRAAETGNGDAGNGDDGARGDGAGTGSGPSEAPAAGPAPAAEEAEDVELELSYHVADAAWVPAYHLHLGDGDGDRRGRLVMRGQVVQRTGEDWRGVALALSTADLNRRTDLPELRSLRIGRRQQEPPAPGWREPPAGLDGLFADYDAAVHAAAARAAAPPAPQDAAGGGAPDTPARHHEASAPPPAAGGPAAPPPPPPSAAPPPPAVPRGPAAAGPRSEGLAAYAAAPADEAAAEPRRRRRALARTAPGARQRTAGSGPPGADLLDYAALVLTGPGAPPGERGTLRPADPPAPGRAAGYGRRAEAVGEPLPAHAHHPGRSAGSFDHRYDSAAPADIDADGVWHTVHVHEAPVELDTEYVTAPAADPTVYTAVRITNTSPHPLLAGPADVTAAGDFLTTVPLASLAPGESRAVGIGAAESVQVARRVRTSESTAGLRNGTTVLDRTVEVELANRLPHPVTVTVRERVPVSEDRDVRIEEHGDSGWTDPGAPGPGEDRYVRGTRVWTVHLEPGRTATRTGGYRLRIPAGKAVVGGNRRD